MVTGIFSGSNTLVLSMDSGQKLKDVNSTPLQPAFLVEDVKRYQPTSRTTGQYKLSAGS